jgi:hypothetical protein
LIIPRWAFWSFLLLATLSRLLNCTTLRLSSTTSHGLTVISDRPGLLQMNSGFGARCVLTVASGGFSAAKLLLFVCSFLVAKVLSSTLLPGFFGPGSSVLSVNLPPSAPSPPRDYPPRLGFMVTSATLITSAGGLPWVRRTTSPYPVQLHSGSVHRIYGLAIPCKLDLFPTAI